VHAQLEAGHAGLGDDEFGRAYPKLVADVHGTFEQAFRREVLSKDVPRKADAGKLGVPVFVVFRWIRVDNFVGPSVHAQV